MRGVSEGTLLLDESSQVRELALSRIRDTGATTVRIPVDWRDFVAADPPAELRRARPGEPGLPVRRTRRGRAERRGGRASNRCWWSPTRPAFAEAPHRWPYAYPGSWAPSPTALEEFAAALAHRYDGSFPDPATPGRALPRVRLFQAWNEPNLARYLEPQWVAQEGHWSAFSPLLYRQLLNGFYAGVKSVEPTDTVITAGVAPNGDPAGVGRMEPVTFLREVLCLGSADAPTARPPARKSGAVSHASGVPCPEPPHFDVLAFHPLSVGDPDLPAASSLDVSISDAAKITGLLKQAERAGTALPAGAKPVWVTELNWESAPPAPGGVPDRLQAQWISRALHRLWVAGVGLVDWQFLIDPYPAERAGTPTGGIDRIPAPGGALQRRGRRQSRKRPAEAVPARLHVPVRPAAGGPRARPRVGAADGTRTGRPVATAGAWRCVAGDRAPARRPQRRAQRPRLAGGRRAVAPGERGAEQRAAPCQRA